MSASVSPGFKTAIQSYLKEVAKNDPLFLETLKKPNKNIDQCLTYILNQVKKSGIQGWDDEAIFAMAVHYYDEDDLKPGAPVNARVVTNYHVDAPAKSEPTAKLSETAQRFRDTPTPPVTAKKPVAKKPVITNQSSLF